MPTEEDVSVTVGEFVTDGKMNKVLVAVGGEVICVGGINVFVGGRGVCVNGMEVRVGGTGVFVGITV